jgi:hypothetical protein
VSIPFPRFPLPCLAWPRAFSTAKQKQKHAQSPPERPQTSLSTIPRPNRLPVAAATRGLALRQPKSRILRPELL